jgi:polar amino acid transport system substrate-binding protein
MRQLLLSLTALLLAMGWAAAQEGRDVIRQQGDLRVCADASNLPFSSADPATPGFEVELAQRIARELGVDARVQWYSSLGLRPELLREGACELFMGLPHDDELLEGTPWLTVSRPYYVMSHALVAKADAGVATLRDLSGQRVAVDAAGVADFYLFYEGFQRAIYRGQEEAFRAVVSGEVPTAFLWLPIASWLARGHPELHVIPVSDPRQEFPTRLDYPIGAGLRHRDQELAAAVDRAIERLQASGEAQAILERYGAIATPRPLPASGAATAPQAQDPVAAGRSVYATTCSRCHGAEGAGGGPGGTVPTLRNYDGGQEKFLRIVENGRGGTPMAPFKGILTREEILSVYQYLTSLPPQ